MKHPSARKYRDMSDLIERLQGIAGTSDHERGCAGREYSCSCGFDDLVEELCDKAQSTLRTQSATITQLQAELADAREVPGRIVAWLRGEVQYHRKHPEDQAFARHIATAIEAHDWSKP